MNNIEIFEPKLSMVDLKTFEPSKISIAATGSMNVEQAIELMHELKKSIEHAMNMNESMEYQISPRKQKLDDFVNNFKDLDYLLEHNKKPIEHEYYSYAGYEIKIYHPRIDNVEVVFEIYIDNDGKILSYTPSNDEIFYDEGFCEHQILYLMILQLMGKLEKNNAK
jgi:hypothetical protein